jgi:hypothetical protein
VCLPSDAYAIVRAAHAWHRKLRIHKERAGRESFAAVYEISAGAAHAPLRKRDFQRECVSHG